MRKSNNASKSEKSRIASFLFVLIVFSALKIFLAAIITNYSDLIPANGNSTYLIWQQLSSWKSSSNSGNSSNNSNANTTSQIDVIERAPDLCKLPSVDGLPKYDCLHHSIVTDFQSYPINIFTWGSLFDLSNNFKITEIRTEAQATFLNLLASFLATLFFIAFVLLMFNEGIKITKRFLIIFVISLASLFSIATLSLFLDRGQGVYTNKSSGLFINSLNKSNGFTLHDYVEATALGLTDTLKGLVLPYHGGLLLDPAPRSNAILISFLFSLALASGVRNLYILIAFSSLAIAAHLMLGIFYISILFFVTALSDWSKFRLDLKKPSRNFIWLFPIVFLLAYFGRILHKRYFLDGTAGGGNAHFSWNWVDTGLILIISIIIYFVIAFFMSDQKPLIEAIEINIRPSFVYTFIITTFSFQLISTLMFMIVGITEISDAYLYSLIFEGSGRLLQLLQPLIIFLIVQEAFKKLRPNYSFKADVHLI